MKREKQRQRGRPLKGDVKRVRTSFTLHPDQLAWLKSKSKELNIKKSELLECLIHNAQFKESTSQLSVHVRFPISKDKLKKFCERHHIKKFSLFGSILREDFGPESDVDILVEFEPQHKVGFLKLVSMEEELSQLLSGRKVELKTAQELSRYFRSDVLAEAEVLYAA